MKRPSFQFYPADWLRDTALRTCSVAARGLWMDMICFMHEGTPYGHLKVNQKVILPVNLAVMVGANLADVESWMHELETAGVFDRGDDGVVYSRRMVRDEELREIRASGGKKGGNPALTGARLSLEVNLPTNLPVNRKVVSEDKQITTPSSSSSSSSSKEHCALRLASSPTSEKKTEAIDFPEGFNSPEAQKAYREWIQHRKELRKKLTPSTISKQLSDLAKMGEANGIAAIAHSIAKGWQGIFQPQSNSGTPQTNVAAGGAAKPTARLRYCRHAQGGQNIPVNPDPYSPDNLREGYGDPLALKDANGEDYGPGNRNPAHRWGTTNLGVPMPVNGGAELATDDLATRKARNQREASCDYI